MFTAKATILYFYYEERELAEICPHPQHEVEIFTTTLESSCKEGKSIEVCQTWATVFIAQFSSTKPRTDKTDLEMLSTCINRLVEAHKSPES